MGTASSTVVHLEGTWLQRERHLPLQRQGKEKPTGAAVCVTCSPAPTDPRGSHRQGESRQKNRERKGDQGAGQSFGRADNTKPSEAQHGLKSKFCFFTAFRSSFQPLFPGRILPFHKRQLRPVHRSVSFTTQASRRKDKTTSKCRSLSSLTLGSVIAQSSDLEIGQHSLSLWGAGVHTGDEPHERAHLFASPAAPNRCGTLAWELGSLGCQVCKATAARKSPCLGT